MFLALLLSSLLTFVELNCENLFDTRHDSLKNDMEFTPEGSYHWTRTRYWRKLNNLARLPTSGLSARTASGVRRVRNLLAKLE